MRILKFVWVIVETLPAMETSLRTLGLKFYSKEQQRQKEDFSSIHEILQQQQQELLDKTQSLLQVVQT